MIEYDYWQGKPAWQTERTYVDLWNFLYREAQQKEWDEWYHKSARFPGDLAPEYNVRWQRLLGLVWFRPRYRLWYWTFRQVHRRARKAGKNYHRWIWLEEFVRDWLLGWPKWQTPEWNYCLFCGYQYDFTSVMDSDWFHFDRGGTAFNGEYTEHWFQGTWTCPRCLNQWEYEDSN